MEKSKKQNRTENKKQMINDKIKIKQVFSADGIVSNRGVKRRAAHSASGVLQAKH